MRRNRAVAGATLALLLVACAAREWSGEESPRIETIVGVGEEMPDEDAVEGNALPREVSADRAKPAVERTKQAAGAEPSRVVRRRSTVRIAKSKRDAVGLATDLEAVKSGSGAGKAKAKSAEAK